MNRLDVLLRYGARYRTEGHNGVVLSVERDRIAAAGHDPVALCPAFAEEARLALKVMFQPARGIAAEEREKQIAGAALLEELGTAAPARMPRVLHEATAAELDEPQVLERLCGHRPAGGHVEFLLMEWVDGLDFATMAYQHALNFGLKRTGEELGEKAMRREAWKIMESFLDDRIMAHARRIDPAAPDAPQAHRVGGLLRKAIRENGNVLRVWESLLPAAREAAERAYGVKHLLSQLHAQEECGQIGHTQDAIAAQLDADALDRAIRAANPVRLADYTLDNSKKGRLDAFAKLMHDVVRGRMERGYVPLLGLQLPHPLHARLTAAIRHLNERGFYHNDLHERNIMLSHDRRGLFIIDVATASAAPATPGGDLGIVHPDSLFSAATRP